jgi:calcineurin-like phosphoesterase family protein
MNTWITSDTHFFHLNIAGPSVSKWKSGYRCFMSVQEMNNTIITNINNFIKEDDTLFHLGDFAMGNRKEIPAIRERIHCKNIILIYGNHDRQIKLQYKHLFTACHEYWETTVNSILVTMMHFPIASWNEIGRGSINLHGHSHGRYKPIGRQMDVGMDCTNYMPLLLTDVVTKLVNIPIVEVDGHTGETNYG